MAVLGVFSGASGGDYNRLILKELESMPDGGVYASYRKDLPEGKRFDDLHQTVGDLHEALSVDRKGRLRVNPKKASDLSFCSSATYLLFSRVIERLQKEGVVTAEPAMSEALADVGDKYDVIGGKLDGIGIFGHWNADGPGTAVLFEKLQLGRNFSNFDEARPGDFLKIFWNEHIGKGERGHLVLYLGKNEEDTAIEVWSSNLQNTDGSSGYGRMWVDKNRIERALFSRLESPENLERWLRLPEAARSSEYLIRIRQTGSSGEEMKKVTGAVN